MFYCSIYFKHIGRLPQGGCFHPHGVKNHRIYRGQNAFPLRRASFYRGCNGCSGSCCGSNLKNPPTLSVMLRCNGCNGSGRPPCGHQWAWCPGALRANRQWNRGVGPRLRVGPRVIFPAQAWGGLSVPDLSPDPWGAGRRSRRGPGRAWDWPARARSARPPH